MPRVLNKPWLDSFLDYTDNTEIPLDWLIWAGISAISTSIKRNCWVTYRRIPFYPNQYIILVGPPGIGKGEAIHFATELTNAAGTVNYLTDWNTPQEMIDEIATGYTKAQMSIGSVATASLKIDRSACILGKELAVVLQSYDNLHTILCEWWDQNEFKYKTKNKGKYTITEMCISMFAACVPDYIRSLSRDRMAAITGGFTARCLFSYATEKRQLLDHAFGVQNNILSQLKDDLVNDLIHINSLSGEMFLDNEAEKLWQKTYREHNKLGDSGSDAGANFKSRISSHIIKTAIAISLGESDSKCITRNQLERAIGYVEQIRDQIDVVFRAVGESPIAVSQDIVLTYVQKKGQTTFGDIIADNYKNINDEMLNQILNVLQYARKVKIDVNGTGGQVIQDYNYKPPVKVMATTTGKGNP